MMMLQVFIGIYYLHLPPSKCNISYESCLYVTGFVKTCLVHTYDFAHLEIHKNHMEWYIDLKISEVIKELWFYSP